MYATGNTPLPHRNYPPDRRCLGGRIIFGFGVENLGARSTAHSGRWWGPNVSEDVILTIKFRALYV